VERGFPPEALLFTMVMTECGEWHAVLTVRTSKRDVCLDNRSSFLKIDALPTPEDLKKAGYTFAWRQAHDGSNHWIVGPSRVAPTSNASNS
jgi:predicted transglutaminase-like cysteine proteinase